MGLAVGAACIALAVFLPGIGTVAAGALLGAGMGAICQTAYKASEEWERGNLRGTEVSTKGCYNFYGVRRFYRCVCGCVSSNGII